MIYKIWISYIKEERDPGMGITNTRSKLDNAAMEEAIEALKRGK